MQGYKMSRPCYSGRNNTRRGSYRSHASTSRFYYHHSNRGRVPVANSYPYYDYSLGNHDYPQNYRHSDRWYAESYNANYNSSRQTYPKWDHVHFRENGHNRFPKRSFEASFPPYYRDNSVIKHKDRNNHHYSARGSFGLHNSRGCANDSSNPKPQAMSNTVDSAGLLCAKTSLNSGGTSNGGISHATARKNAQAHSSLKKSKPMHSQSRDSKESGNGKAKKPITHAKGPSLKLTRKPLLQQRRAVVPKIRVCDRSAIRRLANGTCRSVDKVKLKLLIQEHAKKVACSKATLSRINEKKLPARKTMDDERNIEGTITVEREMAPATAGIKNISVQMKGNTDTAKQNMPKYDGISSQLVDQEDGYEISDDNVQGNQAKTVAAPKIKATKVSVTKNTRHGTTSAKKCRHVAKKANNGKTISSKRASAGSKKASKCNGKIRAEISERTATEKGVMEKDALSESVPNVSLTEHHTTLKEKGRLCVIKKKMPVTKITQSESVKIEGGEDTDHTLSEDEIAENMDFSRRVIKVELPNEEGGTISPDLLSDTSTSILDLLTNAAVQCNNDFSDPAIDAIRNMELSLLSTRNQPFSCAVGEASSSTEPQGQPEFHPDANIDSFQENAVDGSQRRETITLSDAVRNSSSMENPNDASTKKKAIVPVSLVQELLRLSRQEESLHEESRRIEQTINDLNAQIEELRAKLNQVKESEEELERTRRNLLLDMEESISLPSTDTPNTCIPRPSLWSQHNISAAITANTISIRNFIRRRCMFDGVGRMPALSRVLPAIADASAQPIAFNEVTGNQIISSESRIISRRSNIGAEPDDDDDDDNGDGDNNTFNQVAFRDPLEVNCRSIKYCRVHSASISCIKIFGDYVVIGGIDGQTKRFNLLDDTDIRFYPGHFQTVTSVHLRDPFLYVSSYDCHLMKFGYESGVLIESALFRSPILCMSEGWQNLYVGLYSGDVVVFSLTTDNEIDNFKCSRTAISCIATASQGAQHLLCIASCDTVITVWDAVTQLLLRCVEVNISPTATIQMKVFHNLIFINSMSRTNHGICIHELSSGSLIQTINLPSYASSFCVTDDWIIASTVDGKVRFYSYKRNRWTLHSVLQRSDSSVAVSCMTGHNSLVFTANVLGKFEAFAFGY